jgi:digeranylgeranylglycerophospholipid reductase
VERRPRIGEPVHTSGATAIATVERFAIPRELWHPIARARFVSTSAEASFEYRTPPLCVIDVRATYRWLAERAEDAGAKVATRTRFVAPVLDGGRLAGAEIVSGGVATAVRAHVVVDASGYRAVVAKEAGLHSGFDRFGVGYEYDLYAPRCRQDEVVIVVGERYAPAGYGWIFPWGEDRVRVGVGVHHADTRASPQRHLDLLMEEAKNLGVDLRDASIREHHVGLVPAEKLPERLVSDGLLAVGDAASQATLVAGEGIRVSLVGGEIAGRAVADAVASGDTSAHVLSRYESAFRAQFERKLRIGYALNRRLARLDDRGWDRSVRALRRFPPEAVALLLQSEFGGPLLRSAARSPSAWVPLVRAVTAGFRLGRRAS